MGSEFDNLVTFADWDRCVTGRCLVNWKMSDDRELVQYFEGENVWNKDWERIVDEKAELVDHRGAALTLAAWEASFGARRKKFTAIEASNNVWIFALPQP
jgi:hypothetical protein